MNDGALSHRFACAVDRASLRNACPPDRTRGSDAEIYIRASRRQEQAAIKRVEVFLHLALDHLRRQNVRTRIESGDLIDLSLMVHDMPSTEDRLAGWSYWDKQSHGVFVETGA